MDDMDDIFGRWTVHHGVIACVCIRCASDSSLSLVSGAAHKAVRFRHSSPVAAFQTSCTARLAVSLHSTAHCLSASITHNCDDQSDVHEMRALDGSPRACTTEQVNARLPSGVVTPLGAHTQAAY